MGFIASALCIIAITAYGFSLSLRPNTLTLNSADEEPLALVGVALANNLGTDIPRSNSIPVNLPQDVQGVQSAIMKDGFGGEDFFSEHFERINAFREVANIDVIAYLQAHPVKMPALESYIQQLTEKTEEAKTAVATLTQLNNFHINALSTSQINIKNAQSAIEKSYSEQNSADIMDGLAYIEELHIEEQEHKNISIFAKRFLLEYNAIINASEKKLTVLKANSAALTQWITVSLPAGIDIKTLKDLHLFSTENT